MPSQLNNASWSVQLFRPQTSRSPCFWGFAFSAMLLILSLVPQLYGQDWPAFRGGAERTGYAPDIRGLPEGAPLWRLQLGAPIISSPVISGGIVYLGCRDSSLHALELATGKELWRKRTRGWVDGSAVAYGNVIAFGSRDSNIYIVDAATGSEINRLRAGLQLSSPGVTAAGQLIVGMGPPFTRATAYRFTTNAWSELHSAWLLPFTQSSYSSPALNGSKVVMGANDGSLYCFDTTTQGLDWRLPLGGNMYLSTPAIDSAAGIVYFAPGGENFDVYAVRLSDGARIWKSTPAAPGLGRQSTHRISPRFLSGLQRFSPEFRKKALARRYPGSLGKRAAQGSFLSYGEIKTSSVAVDQQRIYIARKELGVPQPVFTLLALDKSSGAELWRRSEYREGVPAGYTASPVVTPNAVFCGWADGQLFAANPATGDLIWKDSLPGHILSTPAISRHTLVAATTDGVVIAYRLGKTAAGENFQRDTYCYPNPARKSDPRSYIQVYVEKAAQLSMILFNQAERPVRSWKESIPEGKRVFDWALAGVANGVYFVRIEVTYANGSTEKKILKLAVAR